MTCYNLNMSYGTKIQVVLYDRQEYKVLIGPCFVTPIKKTVYKDGDNHRDIFQQVKSREELCKGQFLLSRVCYRTRVVILMIE